MLCRALCVCGLVAVALALASCGSSGTSQDELNEARTEGAKEAQQQAKIEKIEGQLKSLKHGHGAPNRPNTSGSSTPASSGNCGGSLSVGPNTTCAFAENVEYEYFAEIGAGSGTVTAYSPVTEKLYSMYCTAGEPHECSGGNNATVYFP
jgi:type II secretory pathway pseudopilin PulG